MKNLLILAVLVFSTTTLFAQEEWGNVEKNNLTVKEIAPVWPGCENGSTTEQEDCFNKSLSAHISKNFRYPAEAYKNNEQGKVVVDFNINEKGMVEILKVSGGTKSLREEAKRNILLIPKMQQPGMMAGKPRSIKYTVPLTFSTGK